MICEKCEAGRHLFCAGGACLCRRCEIKPATVGQFVKPVGITAEELDCLRKAKWWLRRFYCEGSDLQLDAIERDGLHDLLKPLESLLYKLESKPSPALDYTGI